MTDVVARAPPPFRSTPPRGRRRSRSGDRSSSGAARGGRLHSTSRRRRACGGASLQFLAQGPFRAPRRSRGAPFAVDRLRGLPRGRDGAGQPEVSSGAVRHGAKNVSPALLPLHHFFRLQLGKFTFKRQPRSCLPRPRRGRHSSTPRPVPRRRMAHVVVANVNKAGYLMGR